MLFPSQRITFLGTVIDSVQMRAWLTPDRALSIQQLTALFKAGSFRPLRTFQRALGLLHMRPLQRWLKPRVPSRAWRHGHLRIRVSHGCIKALAPWKNTSWYQSGVSMGVVSKRKVISTDASNLGWGALCEGRPSSGLWSSLEKSLHINCLEMSAVFLALKTFLPSLAGHHILVRTRAGQYGQKKISR